jgi:hypothetical protein
MVHVTVAPGAGVTPRHVVWCVPGQVGVVNPTIHPAGGWMCSVSEQELLQLFASVTVKFTVTVPVMFGMLISTVCESPPTDEAMPPL